MSLVGVFGVSTQTTTDDRFKTEVAAADNFVVDSNVRSAPSCNPSAAHPGVKVCNKDTTTLTDGVVHIGDLTNPLTGSGAPGFFPSRTVTGIKGDSESVGWAALENVQNF